MRIFRPLVIVGKYDKTINIKTKMGSYGVDGKWIEINGETAIKNDFSTAYEIDGTTLVLKIEDSYTPFISNSKHIGIKEFGESIINIWWYEKDIDPSLVIDGWNKYKNIVPFDKIVGYLISRDLILAKICKFINAIPSWDICLILPLYMKLCQEIPGFEDRIRIATEIGDQIRGNLNKLDKHIRNKTFKPQMLDTLLEKLHSLSDELELAYNINKLGYEISFGGRGEPDYVINGIYAEQKSRFPLLNPFEKIDISSNFNYSDVLNELILEVKNVKEGLKRAEIYFNNLSRVIPALKFHYVVEMTRHGLGADSFNFSDMFCDFKTMMSSAMKFHKKGKVVVPYIKPICSDPKIIAPFPIPEETLDIILNKRRKERR